MTTIHLSSAYERFVDQLAQRFTPEEILAIQLSEAEQEHFEDLLDRNSENNLTVEERNELQQLLELEKMVSLLKSKVAYTLNQK